MLLLLLQLLLLLFLVTRPVRSCRYRLIAVEGRRPD